MNLEKVKEIIELFILNEIQIHKDLIISSMLPKESEAICKDRIKYFEVMLKHLKDGYSDNLLEIWINQQKVKKSKKKD